MNNVNSRLQRWRSFGSDQNEEPFLFLINAWGNQPDLPFWGPPNRPQNLAQKLDHSLRSYEYMLHRGEWLQDDHIPYLCAMTGTELFAEAFGCPVHLADNSAPAARPLVTSASEADRLHAPELSSSSLAFLFDLAEAMRDKAGTAPLLRMPDISCPMDLVGMIWDKSDLFCAMLETPEAVKRLAGEAKKFIIAFNDEWLSRYGAERIAHWPDVYIERGICLTADEVGAIGNEMFEEFFLPDLIELSRRYGGLGMHCCAGAERHFDSFMKIPGLTYLNLTSPILARNDPAEHRHYLQRTYSKFSSLCPQCHGWWYENDWKANVDSIPPGAKVIFDNIWVKDDDEAKRICDELNILRDHRMSSSPATRTPDKPENAKCPKI